MSSALPSNVMSVAGLKHIEDLLGEIGADTSTLHVAQPKSLKPRVSSSNSKSRRNQDCLNSASKHDHSQLSPVSPISRRSNSSMRGASFAGKNGSESLYLGHGFTGPSRESPGPIYQPISTLDTTHGQSFTRAARIPPSQHRSVSRGPDIVLPPSIGKQNLSNNMNQPNVLFSKAERWKPTAKTNAPIAYQTLDSTNDGKSYSFGNSKTVAANKIFISRGHIADCQGLDSPGPKYFLEDPYTRNEGKEDDKSLSAPAFVALKSKYTNGPSFSFATKKRMEEDRSGTSEGRPPRSKSVEPSKEPGPGQYNPQFTLTEASAPTISFTKQRVHSASYIRKTSAGPANPEKAHSFLDKHVSAVSWGNPHDSFNRMNDKVYLGKGMDMGKGRDSPGPALVHPAGYTEYDPNWRNGKYVGPGVSISFKEKSVTKKLHPGPDKARFISNDLAKENLGAFSPGPKYLLGTHPGWEKAPSVSFGVSDRYFSDNFSPEHRAKFGTAEKPYTSPGQARFVSLMHSKVALSGMASPGPKGNPTIEATSKYTRAPAVGIAPPPSSVSRTREADDAKVPSLYNPSYAGLDMDQHVHSFGKAKRMPDLTNTGIPGPGQYQPLFSQVESRVQEVSIGIL